MRKQNPLPLVFFEHFKKQKEKQVSVSIQSIPLVHPSVLLCKKTKSHFSNNGDEESFI